MSIASDWDESLKALPKAAKPEDLIKVPFEDLRALVDAALEWHKLGVKTLVTQSLEAERLDKENTRLKARVELLEKALTAIRDYGPRSFKPAFFHDCSGACSWCLGVEKALEP